MKISSGQYNAMAVDIPPKKINSWINGVVPAAMREGVRNHYRTYRMLIINARKKKEEDK